MTENLAIVSYQRPLDPPRLRRENTPAGQAKRGLVNGAIPEQIFGRAQGS
jgi:hypothetical protein